MGLIKIVNSDLDEKEIISLVDDYLKEIYDSGFDCGAVESLKEVVEVNTKRIDSMKLIKGV
jgi:hypothetical protein